MNWQELSQASLDDILTWAADQPWCRAMADCQQDAGWHSEGDVWTHTLMVCTQLPQLDGWSSLTQQEQTVLLFTALFHDSAKPLTSRVDAESGRIRSPKHAIKGEHLTRKILRELGCELKIREEIARMVRFHGRPAFLLEKSDPKHEVVSLSWLVNHKLLYFFALADTRGRKTKEMSRPIEKLQMWKMVAEENDCFEQPYCFANDHARFLFYRNQKSNLYYVPHEDYSCTATLLSGLPGSGKDTWLSKTQANIPVVSLDKIRSELHIAPTENQGDVVQTAREQCREFLRAGADFAFNATNLLRMTRQRWISLFAEYSAKIKLVYVEPPFEVILRQNKQRTNSVPEKVIHELAQKTEPPTWTEGHQLVFAEG